MNTLATTSPGPEQAGPEQDPGTIVKIPGGCDEEVIWVAGRCDEGSSDKAITVISTPDGPVRRCPASPEGKIHPEQTVAAVKKLANNACRSCVHGAFLS